jgi:hypothetical protein
MKGAALVLVLALVVAVVVVFPASAAAQVRGVGHAGVGFYGGGRYGGYWGGPWWPFWWPYYAAPIYYGSYFPYYAYPSAPPYVDSDPPASATHCYAPKVDQSGKVLMMPDYSKPVPCSASK